MWMNNIQEEEFALTFGVTMRAVENNEHSMYTKALKQNSSKEKKVRYMAEKQPIGNEGSESNPPKRGMLLPKEVIEDDRLSYLFTRNPESAKFLFENPDLARLTMRNPDLATILFDRFKSTDSNMKSKPEDKTSKEKL